MTVVHFATVAPSPVPLDVCSLLADNRAGLASVVAGVIQRLGVSPDGSGVVFEVTNAFQVAARISLTPDEMGFFYVRADGSGLRRLAPPSQVAAYVPFVNSAGQLNVVVDARILFSPDGRLVAYRDFGPGPDGESALQLFSLDTRDGKRTQLTKFPRPQIPTPPSVGVLGTLANPFFRDDHTVVTASRFFDGALTEYVAKTDGRSILRRPLASPPKATGGGVKDTFRILPTAGQVAGFFLSDPTKFNANDPTSAVYELFWRSGRELLQLTNFGRADTDAQAVQHSLRRVVMTASADPLGTNPSHRCQFFDVSNLGGRYRQLTRFGNEGPGPGCYDQCRLGGTQVDAMTRSIVFSSDCDLVDGGAVGNEVFSLRADGSDLGQITRTQGVHREADGSLDVEMPGPFAVPTVDP